MRFLCFCIWFCVEVENKFEKFYEGVFGVGRDCGVWEDIFVGGRNLSERWWFGSRWILLKDKKRVDSKEFDLVESFGGDELGDEFGFGVYKLRCEGDIVGFWG